MPKHLVNTLGKQIECLQFVTPGKSFENRMLEVFIVVTDCLAKYKIKEMSADKKWLNVNRNEIEKF